VGLPGSEVAGSVKVSGPEDVRDKNEFWPMSAGIVGAFARLVARICISAAGGSRRSSLRRDQDLRAEESARARTLPFLRFLCRMVMKTMSIAARMTNTPTMMPMMTGVLIVPLVLVLVLAAGVKEGMLTMVDVVGGLVVDTVSVGRLRPASVPVLWTESTLSAVPCAFAEMVIVPDGVVPCLARKKGMVFGEKE